VPACDQNVRENPPVALHSRRDARWMTFFVEHIDVFSKMDIVPGHSRTASRSIRLISTRRSEMTKPRALFGQPRRRSLRQCRAIRPVTIAIFFIQSSQRDPFSHSYLI